MSTQDPSQDTRSQASYISVASSIAAKFRCCIAGDTIVTTTHTHAHNVGIQQEPDAGSDSEPLPVIVETREGE